MRNRLLRTMLLALAAGCVVPATNAVAAQQKAYYDQYEPSERQRLRRESCMRDEEPIGPYCVKQCQKGYVLVAGSKPPRCRSLEPLPSGQLPGPVRKQVGVQAPPPGPRQPPPKSKGGPG